MNTQEILAKVDHTLLAQNAKWEEIRQILDDAVKYGTASSCIPPSFLARAAEYVSCRCGIYKNVHRLLNRRCDL